MNQTLTPAERYRLKKQTLKLCRDCSNPRPPHTSRCAQCRKRATTLQHIKRSLLKMQNAKW